MSARYGKTCGLVSTGIIAQVDANSVHFSAQFYLQFVIGLLKLDILVTLKMDKFESIYCPAFMCPLQ